MSFHVTSDRNARASCYATHLPCFGQLMNGSLCIRNLSFLVGFFWCVLRDTNDSIQGSQSIHMILCTFYIEHDTDGLDVSTRVASNLVKK